MPCTEKEIDIGTDISELTWATRLFHHTHHIPGYQKALGGPFPLASPCSSRSSTGPRFRWWGVWRHHHTRPHWPLQYIYPTSQCRKAAQIQLFRATWWFRKARTYWRFSVSGRWLTTWTVSYASMIYWCRDVEMYRKHPSPVSSKSISMISKYTIGRLMYVPAVLI